MSIQKSILRKWLPWVLLLAIPLYIINTSFDKVLKCPSCYLFEDSGDGLKNYFSLSWYVLHDDGLHFSGMNAPYGEHILFTDNQPILAVALRFVHKNIASLDGHIVGIVNILLILSLFFTVFILYLILRQLSINRYYAVAFAIIITFLSPQISRLAGHYSLAYSFIIPLYFYFFVRYQKSNQTWKWPICMMTLTVVAGLLHLYHFLMLAAFTFLFALIEGVKLWSKNDLRQITKKYKSTFIKLAVVSVIPAVILLGGMKLTDQIDDRPETPYRAHGLNVKFNSTFIPVYEPFGSYWKKTFGTTIPNTESWSYVSLIGLILLPAALVFLIRRKKKRRGKHSSQSLLHTSLWAATLVWILAAGVLYSPLFSWLLDLIPKLKQFRGLGRLSWVFYYIYMIYIAFFLSTLVRKLKLRKMGLVGNYILIVALLVMSFETYFHSRSDFRKLFKDNNYLSAKKHKFSDALAKHQLTAADFQSILMLPMISLGSENVGIARGNWTMRRGVQAAHELGIPLIDYSLSRTSVSQTMDFIQLLSSDGVQKKRLSQMTDQPILVVAEVGLTTPSEQKLLDLSTFIETTEQVSLYSLLPKDMQFNSTKWNSISDTVKYDAPIYFQDFEENKFDDNIMGNGVKIVETAKEKIASYTAQVDSVFEAKIHLWIYINSQESGMSVLRIKELNAAGKVLSDVGIHRDDVDWSEVVGNWIRLDRDLIVKGKGHTYEFYIDAAHTVVDALQIRKAEGQTLVRNAQGDLIFLNGIKIPGK